MILVILNILFLACVFFWLWRRETGMFKKIFWPAVIVKWGAGIALGLLYSFYYPTGDTYQYFEDAKLLSAFARNDFSAYIKFLWDGRDSGMMNELHFADARALFFVKLVSILNLITGDQYWVASIYCSCFAFIGSWIFIKAINKFLPQFTMPYILAFLFLPSVVFWSSGLIKESIACAALFYLSALFVNAWFRRSISVTKSSVGVMALWILWALKYYYVAILVPVAFAFLFYKYVMVYLLNPKSRVVEVVMLATLFIVPVGLFSFAHPNFHYGSFLEVMVSNSKVYTQYSSAEDLIQYYSLEPTIVSVALNAPVALLSGLFRPFITEAGNMLQFFASMENFMILSLCIWVLIRIPKLGVDSHFVLLLAVCVYIGTLCIFLTLSTPNFGTLSRYRVGYLPYFVALLLSEPKVNGHLQTWSKRLFE